jgi:hypothetical protein
MNHSSLVAPANFAALAPASRPKVAPDISPVPLA